MSASLEVRLLGPFEVAVRGVAIDVTGPKRRELLALLALQADRVVGVEALVDALWGRSPPANARNALQHHVARLRQALEPGMVVSPRDGYALKGAAVDALLFEERLDDARAARHAADASAARHAVDDALDLWRGPALLGFLDSDWASAAASRLEALRVDALEEKFDAGLALGEHAELVPAISRAVEESPFRERLWGQLMLALYRSGRQADALDAFQDARRTLSEHLGLEPGPELQRLQAAILAHDPAIGGIPAARTRGGNLPAPITSFIGRRAALVQVRQLLREHRLVTLVGPPGTGKSRVALEVARASEHEMPEGAWMVELTRAGSAADVARVVASALDTPDSSPSGDPIAGVVERLRHAMALLVIDNCEHVLAEAQRVVATLLSSCAGVRVLATSREPLHITGESRLWIAPLAVPDAASRDTRAIAACDAVRLFVERARGARREFELTAETGRLVAQICRRLDGLPLAIELAAAGVNALGVGELLHLLDRQFTLLAQGDRSASEDLHPLKAVVDWSYELLSEDEKLLLRQLAVFRGGCSLPAVVALAARQGLDEIHATRLLRTLVDKSIVRAGFPEGEARYDLLETLREYAFTRLVESGGLRATQAAHAEFFATMARAAAPKLRGREHGTWLRSLGREQDNFWAALTYARKAGDAEVAIRLAAGLGWYFALRNLHAEGRAFLELAVSVANEDTPTAERIEAFAHLCHLASQELDFDAAIDAGERGLSLARAVTAPREAADVRAALALALLSSGSGQAERAARLLVEAQASYEALHDEWGLAGCELTAAGLALRAEDVDEVAASTARILRWATSIEYGPFEVWGLLLDGWVAERRGDGAAATRAYQRALGAARELDLPHYVSFALAQLGASGNAVDVEPLQRRAVAVADAARLPWFAAYARVRLGLTLEAKGDQDAATGLYRAVVDRSRRPGAHDSRESFFVALGGDPVGTALSRLAELTAPARAEDPFLGRTATELDSALRAPVRG